MGAEYVVPQGTPAVRFHAGLCGPEACVTTRRNVFDEGELSLRGEDALKGYPDNCVGAVLVRKGLVVFRRRVAGRVWLLAVAPEHIEGI